MTKTILLQSIIYLLRRFTTTNVGTVVLYFKSSCYQKAPTLSEATVSEFPIFSSLSLCSVDQLEFGTPFRENASINNGGHLQVLILARDRLARRFSPDQSISCINPSDYKADLKTMSSYHMCFYSHFTFSGPEMRTKIDPKASRPTPCTA